MTLVPLALVLATAPLLAPVERALERVSLGPTAGVAATWAGRRPGLLVSLGASVAVFDRYVVTDAACEERRRQERARLGGERFPVLGELMEAVQQPCPPLSKGWWPAGEGGLELGLALGGQTRGQLRAYLSPLAFSWFTLGLSLSGVTGQDAEDDTQLGIRIGPELAWNLRFEGNSRPVLGIVLRPEVSLVRQTFFPHQVVLGSRFLFDL